MPRVLDVEGDELLFNTAEGRRKPDNIRRDPRVIVSVQDRNNRKRVPGPHQKAKSRHSRLSREGGLGSCRGRRQSTHFEWTAKFDSKDYPVKGDPGRDAVSVKKVDDYTLDITNKKGGKVTTTIHAVYAKDGKSRTETVTGTDGQGQKIENVTQWTKQ
jgi:hypothetical protein